MQFPHRPEGAYDAVIADLHKNLYLLRVKKAFENAE
jgi:hypothetical protein